MAYKIYQQLESGMAELGLVESSEVGYTQNADVNATRFKGKTVAGALDNINSILSRPTDIPIPKIKVKYTIYDKDKAEIERNTIQIDLDDILSKTIYVDKGNSVVCEASYSWDRTENRVDPTMIYGGSWDTLTAPNIDSDTINIELTDNHKFWIEFGVEREGLAVEDGLIKPAIVKDVKKSEINIIFRDKIYYGVRESKPETLDGLISDYIISGENTNKEINININNNEIFVFIFPNDWVIEDIIDCNESQLNFWFNNYINNGQMDYCIYNCSFGAYTDKDITFKLKYK